MTLPPPDLVPFDKLVRLERREVRKQPTALYVEIGVRSHGKGIFHKAPRTGADIGKKDIYQVKSGDFIMQIVFAWEGAIAVAGDADDGKVGSHRFLTFRVDEDRCDARYLNWWFKTREALRQVMRISPGAAGRNRTLGSKRLGEIRVPLPPLPEQQRIVAWLDGLAARVAAVRDLRSGLNEDAAAFIASLHLKLAGQRRVALSEVFELDEIEEPVVPTGSYPQVGIRGFGGGLFQKSAITGTSTTYRSFNRLYPDAIVLSQVKGWEGAIAVVGPELDGWFVSPEYRTFRCKPEAAHSDYMRALLPSPWFIEQLRGLSRGQGARRQRTRPEQFLALELPMPTLPQQESALEVFSKMRRAQKSLPEGSDLAALLPSALAQVFGG